MSDKCKNWYTADLKKKRGGGGLGHDTHIWVLNMQMFNICVILVWHGAPYWVISGSIGIQQLLALWNLCEICPALIQMASFVLQVSCWASHGPKVWPRSFVRRMAPNVSTWLWFTHRCLQRSALLWNDPEIWTVAYLPPPITRAAFTSVYSSKPSSSDCIIHPPTTPHPCTFSSWRLQNNVG